MCYCLLHNNQWCCALRIGEMFREIAELGVLDFTSSAFSVIDSKALINILRIILNCRFNPLWIQNSFIILMKIPKQNMEQCALWKCLPFLFFLTHTYVCMYVIKCLGQWTDPAHFIQLLIKWTSLSTNQTTPFIVLY